MIYAVIDIGSNTVRLSVYKSYPDKLVNLFNEKESCGLRSYMKDGVLTEEGIQDLVDVLRKFKLVINDFDEIDKVYPFATASIRLAANRNEIIDRVHYELGMDIEILSGEEEAKLSFAGASSSLELVEGALTDLGGGSSEVVIISQKKVVRSVSLTIGSLSAYNDYVKDIMVKPKEAKKISDEVVRQLEANGFAKEKQSNLCVVGGSGRACLIMYNKYFKQPSNNGKMEAKKLKELVNYMLNLDPKKCFDTIIKVKADRIHTFLPGIVILSTIADYFSSDTLLVSQTGVREGYIYEKVLKE